MSLSTLRQTSLSRYYSIIIPVTVVAASLLAYHVYNSSRSPAAKRLKRSNARRVSRRSVRRNGSTSNPTSAASSSTADPDLGGVMTDEQLVEALNGETGMEIPESVADALVEAAVAAQEARGAGGGDRGRGADDDTSFSFTPDGKENQNLLNLLYLIAEDQSKRDTYVHRGVTCNSCSIMPIRGIRYRCANCVDFDLCEHCEALDSHPKTHLFYKVRIPAPFLGNPRQAQTPWYPGKPGLMPPALPQEVTTKIVGETGFEPPEIEALYEQFKCLAATEYLSDPLKLNGAISRQTFDKCFVPNTHVRPPPPNLIYDRMFAFYDTNADGLIGFEEFVRGLSALNNKHRSTEKLRRIFKGYDLDGDGYVDRKDFLRMFRAFYALSKDLVKDMVASMEDDMLEANQAANVLIGSQPISAAFAGSIPVGSRREAKASADWEADEDADVAEVILPSGDDRVSRAEIASELDRNRSEVPRLPEMPPGAEDDQTFDDWMAPGEDPNSAAAVAATMPVLVPADASSSASSFESSPPPPPVGPSGSRTAAMTAAESKHALDEERRREFFAVDTDDDDSGMGKDQDVGSEILYQITQQGLNEMLDLLFKAKEEAALELRKIETTVKEGEEEDEKKEGENGKEKEKEKETEEIVRDVAKEKGGDGRLNFAEFERIMRGPHRGDLGFVSTWIDMASF